MNISILCSSFEHPIYPYILEWMKDKQHIHDIDLVKTSNDLPGGDILFLISCNEIIHKKVRSKYIHTLVLHNSDLPIGRGWSPHVWQILEGKEELWVSLVEAEDVVDTGDIWGKRKISVDKHELYDEINEKLFLAEMSLMEHAINNQSNIKPIVQSEEGSYYRKRTPEDSNLDPDKTIKEQFDLLRVSDPLRYPAFFKLHGHTYEINIKKV